MELAAQQRRQRHQQQRDEHAARGERRPHRANLRARWRMFALDDRLRETRIGKRLGNRDRKQCHAYATDSRRPEHPADRKKLDRYKSTHGKLLQAKPMSPRSRQNWLLIENAGSLIARKLYLRRIGAPWNRLVRRLDESLQMPPAHNWSGRTSKLARLFQSNAMHDLTARESATTAIT